MTIEERIQRLLRIYDAENDEWACDGECGPNRCCWIWDTRAKRYVDLCAKMADMFFMDVEKFFSLEPEDIRSRYIEQDRLARKRLIPQTPTGVIISRIYVDNEGDPYMRQPRIALLETLWVWIDGNAVFFDPDKCKRLIGEMRFMGFDTGMEEELSDCELGTRVR